MKSIARLLALFATVFTLSLVMTGCELDSSSGDDNGDNNSAGNQDPMVVGSWNVVSDWRWSKMTFNANGTKSQTDRATGVTNNRGTWSTRNGNLILVSDVTETCPYTVTATTLAFTLPSGNRVQLTR
jgi:hypothetical protein